MVRGCTEVLSDALNERFGAAACGQWWAEGGSTKAVDKDSYFKNVYDCVVTQRTLPT